MSNILCLTVRFLTPDPAFHGTRDGGEPEWPPSPLRLFQALVDAAASRWREGQFAEHAKPAFEWFQRLDHPTILAPGHHVETPYRIAVPNNDWDSPARLWAKGGEPVKPHRPIDLKTMKTVRATRLNCESENANVLHYLYSLPDGQCQHLDVLTAAARSVTHLGWGVDMVAADANIVAKEQTAQLPGHRWQPCAVRGVPLRTPGTGTLGDLIRKHVNSVGRLTRNGLRPVPPLSAFRVVGYRRATDSPPRRFAAFDLLKPDASGRRAFDVAHKGPAVAGMMRCATKNAAARAGRDQGWIDSFVLGHGETRGQTHQPVGAERFAYIPLPSIEFRGEGRAEVVGSVRRVLLTVLADGHQPEIDWAGRILSGAELIEKQTEQPQCVLSRLPNNDKRVRRYIDSSSTWATVTPVVLPGYDDSRRYRRRLKQNTDAANQRRWLGKLDRRIDYLVRKAIRQAGFSDTLATHAIVEWRPTGFWPGTDLASRYNVPKHLQKVPRYHIRIQWRDATGKPVQVGGPICLGGGRFYGLGLFAAMKEP